MEAEMTNGQSAHSWVRSLVERQSANIVVSARIRGVRRSQPKFSRQQLSSTLIVQGLCPRLAKFSLNSRQRSPDTSQGKEMI